MRRNVVINQCPRISTIKPIFHYVLRHRHREIAQVYTHLVVLANGLPVGDDAAVFAAYSGEGFITLDVAFGVFGVAVDAYRAYFVIRPNTTDATTERAVAYLASVWRAWERDGDLATMTLATQSVFVFHSES